MIEISNKDREEVIRLLSQSSLYVSEARKQKIHNKERSIKESEILRRSKNLIKKLNNKKQYKK